MNDPLPLVLHQRAVGAPEIHILRDQDGMYRVKKWKRIFALSFGITSEARFLLASAELQKRRFRTIEDLQAAVMPETEGH